MKYLIHSLTIFRVLFAPLIFCLILIFESFALALIIFVLASITDFFDGFLARKYKLTSTLGEILDPIADKILVLFLVISLCIYLNSFYIGICGSLILSREFWVGALRDLNARNRNTEATQVTLMAKFKTTSQFITFSGYLLALTMNNSLMIFISHFFLFLTLIITLQTGLSYTVSSFKSVK